MDSIGWFNNFGIALLNQSNYKIWKSCMGSYLVGEDLWEVVGGCEVNPLKITLENTDALKKWSTTNAKVESILKRSLSHGKFEHILWCKFVAEIWTTIDGLFNKKDMARLQLLENKLANTTQGDLSISQFFFKMKIFSLNPKEPISEA
ncbi:hypothetical protein CIPAW_08G098800 [Carya illinoinensis]|uniref:DUF4219 domain-containing protein n=1 Tax=Carya illinoinensis TaxID=32201 RepID=A0A8T1PL67_CARIL|nr:hypothetical protein CIPAW_08G098800 [Carya illinoinensis]